VHASRERGTGTRVWGDSECAAGGWGRWARAARTSVSSAWKPKPTLTKMCEVSGTSAWQYTCGSKGAEFR